MSIYLRGDVWYYLFYLNGRRYRGSTKTWFRQLDLAPFDLFIWPHPVGESPPAPRSERSPAAPEGRRVYGEAQTLVRENF